MVTWHKLPVIPSLADLTVVAEDISFTLDEVATATTLTLNHYLVMVDASSGAIILTLPAAASHTNRIYTIKKIDSSGNSVTIKGDAPIDDEDEIVLTLQFQYVIIVGATVEWFIIGGQNVKMEELVKDGNETQKEILKLLRLFRKALKKMSNMDLKED